MSADALLAPVRSAWDPPQVAEGALDPLGLYPIADQLGVMLAPGVRERQRDPRYLVPICAGSVVADEVGRDEVAADGLSPPWQVYEWYVVEALVRVRGRESPLRGLPGREKVAAALRRGEPVCARTYLKTPAVFGFHGVYRRLAETLRVVDGDGVPLDGGLELLEVWEREQGLAGFVSGTGEGAVLRRQLVEAVREGMARGRTARSATWPGWQALASHLDPEAAGSRTRNVLWRRLLAGGEVGWRGWLLERLAGDALAWQRADRSERAFHACVRPGAPDGLGRLLRAIGAYERFCRLLQDAFDEVLYRASRGGKRVGPAELAQAPAVARAAGAATRAFDSALEALGGLGAGELVDGFSRAFGALREPGTPEVWVARLLEHHRRVQADKPPAGKAPWLDTFADGTVMTRPAYRREDGAAGGDEYVHPYRTRPLRSFCEALGRVPT